MKFSFDDVFKNEKTKHYLTLFLSNDVDWLEKQIFEKNGKP